MCCITSYHLCHSLSQQGRGKRTLTRKRSFLLSEDDDWMEPLKKVSWSFAPTIECLYVACLGNATSRPGVCCLCHHSGYLPRSWRKRGLCTSVECLSTFVCCCQALASLVYSVTLAAYVCVSELSSIPRTCLQSSTNNGWVRFFVPVTCFVMFNLGDLIGRMLTSVKAWPSVQHHRWLTWPVMARWAFVPLFLFCNIDLNGDTVRGMHVLT
jgi:hypothetical protein